MTKNTKNILVASAVLGLVVGSTLTSSNAFADHKKPHCTKANSCKGKNDCGTDKHSCKGKSEKAGDAWVGVKAADEAACKKAGGNWHADDGHGH